MFDRESDAEEKIDGDVAASADDQMPEEPSCSYCGETDSACLACCMGCERWFCNGSHGTSGSHIVIHMVNSKHRSIKLHQDNSLGAQVLECYICHSTNVFSLGFIRSKEEGVAVVICREPCLHTPKLRELDWDPTSWSPLISERRLLTWICHAPKNPRKVVTLHDIIDLETKWGERRAKTVSSDVFVRDVPLLFGEGGSYADIFLNLLKLESEEERGKDSHFGDVPCRLKKRIGRRCFFELGPFPVSDVTLNRGDCASIRAKGSALDLHGTIIEVGALSADTEYAVFVAEVAGPSVKNVADEILAASTVTIRSEYNAISYKRKVSAVKKFSKDGRCLSAYLYFTILGHRETTAQRKFERNFGFPLVPRSNLNHSQELALMMALNSPLTLIQGPPGTGKTSTSVEIIHRLHQRVKSQILVCAPSNVAVDHLTSRISDRGLKVVRLQARYRNDAPSALEILGLDKQVEDYVRLSSDNERLKELLEVVRRGEGLNNDDYDAYKEGVEQVERKILQRAEVICCTCVGAGDYRLMEMKFKHVLIDEATQGTEPEVLIPLIRGAEQVILVGDHCQLRAVVTSVNAERAGLRRSLFERLVQIGHRPVRLDVQYRMHPALSVFPSARYYEGTLQNGVTAEQRDASEVFPWPDATRPIFFYNSAGKEELGSNGSSYLNRAEAALAEQVVTRLLRGGVDPEDIGVITPYRSQCRYVRSCFFRCDHFPASTYNSVEVSSVDAFQGREKGFIILSCVRSNHCQGIGFLVDERRLNVSLTRAKRGLIILGNVQLLSRYGGWHELLVYLRGLSLIVEGPIDELTPSNVVLQKPHKREKNAERKSREKPLEAE